MYIFGEGGSGRGELENGRGKKAGKQGGEGGRRDSPIVLEHIMSC